MVRRIPKNQILKNSETLCSRFLYFSKPILYSNTALHLEIHLQLYANTNYGLIQQKQYHFHSKPNYQHTFTRTCRSQMNPTKSRTIQAHSQQNSNNQ